MAADTRSRKYRLAPLGYAMRQQGGFSGITSRRESEGSPITTCYGVARGNAMHAPARPFVDIAIACLINGGVVMTINNTLRDFHGNVAGFDSEGTGIRFER